MSGDFVPRVGESLDSGDSRPMIKLAPIGKWISLEEIKEMEKQVLAQDELIERGREYIEDEIEELEDEIRSKRHAIERLEDESLSIPADSDHLLENHWDMVRWFAGPDEKTVRGMPLPHLEYADSKRKVWVRSFKRDSKPFENIPIEEPLESAPA